MKTNVMIRFLCGLLCLMMLIGVFPAASFAEGEDGETVANDLPDFDAQFDADAVSVDSAASLEAALSAEAGVIRLDADVTLDRTLFVTADAVLYTVETHTLTRDADFAGDLFVVGERPDGTVCPEPVRLTLGDPRSEENDLLIIDGNKDQTSVDVTGTAIFVVNGMFADVYPNLTVRNCRKTGNVKTGENADYGVSYPEKIGGAAMIVCKSAKVSVLGGKFENNEVNDYSASSEISCQGGAVYNFGTLYIYGGRFENNRAGRGGAFFNYRTLYFFNGEIVGNTSSDAGGGIYVPASTAAYTYFGEKNDRIENPAVLIENNVSGSYGAGIYGNHILYVRHTTFRGNSNTVNTAGAIFASGMHVTVSDSVFENNSAANNGGAIYVTGSNGSEDLVELYAVNCAFTGNEAGSKGGGIYITSGARACLIRVTASQNRAVNGGFLMSDASAVSVYSSRFENNASSKAGGAINLQAGSVTKIYGSEFEANEAGTNGGAMGVYTSEAETVVQDCIFTANKADGGYGGAFHVSTKGNLKVYSSEARGNSAKQGGFLYETVTGSSVSLAGVTLAGNAAAEGGDIVWGNSAGAKLYIDKDKYTDEDYAGEYDDDYFAAAIANALNVSFPTLVIPSYVNYDGTTVEPEGSTVSPDVYSASQLEKAIAAGIPTVVIKADFLLDRTFYIPHELTVTSDGAHVLTRAPGFGGDLFVIGEGGEGIPSESPAALTLGDPASGTEDLLTVDGNRENMTVDVTGTVFFVATGSTVRIYPNLTVRNCFKTGNARTLQSEYAVSYPEKIGGAVAILTDKSYMSVYGGRIVGNGVNTANVGGEQICFQGGAIYNYGTLNVYGGVFENNGAKSGGAIFNYRRLHLYGGAFKGNTAAESGGAVYMPNSTVARTRIGEESALSSGAVLFEGNTAEKYGGAIYARNELTVSNALFDGNTAVSSSGGAVACFEIRASFDNTAFKNNSAGNYAGALYFNGQNTASEEQEAELTFCVFEGNTAASNGGAVYMAGGPRVRMTGVDFKGNSSGASGGAVYLSGSTLDVNGSTAENNTAASNGGAFMPNSGSVLILNNVTAKGCSAAAGGVLYNKKSTVTLYNSTLEGNAASSAGGAVNVQEESDTKIYNTLFKNNEAGTNAGALGAYSAEAPILLHTCVFEGNKAENGFGGAIHVSSKGNLTAYATRALSNSASQGGFLYETLSGSVVTLIGLAVFENDAADGPIIRGNTFNAVLNIDKSKYTDLEIPAPYGESYWSGAIENKLTVNDISGEIPAYTEYGNEPYDTMPDAVDVGSAAELEEAIRAGAPHIRVVSDFALDRTYYITGDTTVFSTAPHTLTRDPAFGGDVFVVGEDENGTPAFLTGRGAKLVLGNPTSVKEHLLVIDGNSGNMTARVVGSIVYMTGSAHAEFYPNLTVKNCRKEGNERTLDERYLLHSNERVGGSVAAVESGLLDIYGGNYLDNRVNGELAADEETGVIPNNASNGGAFCIYGHMRIFDGRFENNEGGRGGLIYTYRVVRIYAGVFKGNHALVSGGVVYSSSVAPSNVTVGTGVGDKQAVFEDNLSDGNGGCFQISALAACVILGNCVFRANSAQSGAVACAYGSLSVFNALFEENRAASRGGAIYLSNQKEEETTRVVNIVSCTFLNNTSPRGGALSVFASSADYAEGGVVTVSGSTFTGNRAAAAGGTTTTFNGGAIHVDRKGKATVENCTFDGNASDDEAGSVYASNGGTVVLKDSVFTGSSSVGNAGTVSLHSAFLTAENVRFLNGVSGGNGAAVYVSYSGSCDFNSTFKATNCLFDGNEAGGYGGAVYTTRREVTADARILDVRLSTFSGNSAKKAGGAVYVLSGVKGYFADDLFENNATQTDGGAVGTLGELEFDTVTFTGNRSEKTGGALALLSGAETKVYAGTFTDNAAGTNGGGAVMTTGENNVSLFHSCSFTGNTAVLGGGAYATGAGTVKMYAAKGAGNSADKGGFLYITTTGTTFDLIGAEVSGNTAVTGGSVIWGNAKGAVLNINKDRYTDLDAEGALDDAYWAQAIVNKLTVNAIAGTVPNHTPYAGSGDKPVTPPTPGPLVPVSDVFDLSQSSSDGFINSVYDSFEVLDHSSNFMSTSKKVFENVNGGDVTVDTYVYHTNTVTDNVSVGVGLMIYQAMRYKEAYPDEDVYIDVSAYRFSVQTAVNINRNSRYFGYVRNLDKLEYDTFGFVRISYLLVSAAKMGIHVNAIGHLDAYPLGSGPRMVSYFESRSDQPCDPAYVPDGSVRDYLKFTFCKWTLDGKGGTDMMHTKLCAVSHYLDMNGKAHRNAVWTSSANLDGTTDKGYNANWKLQTATIVSDHAELYRVSVNYLRLIADCCEQEDVYIFRGLVNERNTEQAALILSGKGDTIPANEQILYLGTPEDDVFELYFSPFGGGVTAWDEVNNPYCKYLRKMYESEGYIRFAWSVAEYSGNNPVNRKIEEMIAAAFHKNADPQNKIYVVADSFPKEAFDDLTVGRDVGYKYFSDNVSSAPFNIVHNKDMLLSYVENGQRYYVSILNSLNVHSGSMFYQSNQALVIKEKDCADGNVFSVLAREFTKGDLVTHEFGDEETVLSADPAVHSYVRRVCAVCGEEEVVRVIHNPGEWIVDRAPTAELPGIRHTACTACGVLTASEEILFDPNGGVTVAAQNDGGVARLPEDAPAAFDVLRVPSGACDLTQILDGNRRVPILVLEGTKLDEASVAAIAAAAPVTVYCHKAAEDALFETLSSLPGVSVYDILSVESRIVCTAEDQANTVAVIGRIAGDVLHIDGLTLEVTFSKPGMDDRTFTQRISRIYSTVLGVASVSENTAAAQGTLYIENAAYLFALEIYGIPDGTYTVKAELKGAVDGTEIAGKALSETVVTLPGKDVQGKTGPGAAGRSVNYLDPGAGKQPNGTLTSAGRDYAGTPLTVECVYSLPASYDARGGVLVGTYTGGDEDQINLEVYSGGKLRLWYKVNGETFILYFSTDVRGEGYRHLALTVDGTTVRLYLDGVLAETKELPSALPAFPGEFCFGGDFRANNAQYFKGVLLGVHLFDTVRTDAEIKEDAIMVAAGTPHLIDSVYFTA